MLVCERHADDAVAKGGKVLAGGHKIQGQFFEPTMIAEATAWGAGSHHRMDDYVEITYLCLGDILK